MIAHRASDALDEELWIWVDGGGIHLVAAGRGSDHLVLTSLEAQRAAHRLLDLSRELSAAAG